MNALLRRKLRRDLLKNRTQVIAVAVIVFLGITLFAASYGAYTNLGHSYNSAYEQTNFASLWVTGGDLDALEQQLQTEDAVTAIERRSQSDTPMRMNGEHQLLGRVVSRSAQQATAVNDVMFASGSDLDNSDPRGILLEAHAARHFEIEIGDTIEVLEAGSWRPLTVRGIVNSPEYIWTSRSRQEMLTSDDDFAVIFASHELVGDLLPSASSQLVLSTDSPTDPVLQEIRSIAVELGAMDIMDRSEQPSNAALIMDVEGLGEMSMMFPILFLSVAALASYVLLVRIIRQQRMQLGMLVANGFPSRTITRHVLSYGITISMLGAVPGLVAGVWLSRLVTSSYTTALDIPVTVIKLAPETVVIGIAFALISGLSSAYFPARAATRTAPAEAMRPEAPAVAGRRNLIERILPSRTKLPATVRIALRNISRQRRRSLTTVLGIVMAIVVVLVSAGMLDAIKGSIAEQYSDIELQDATLYLNSSQGAEAIKQTPGVARVEPYLRQQVTVSANGRLFPTELQAFVENTSMHDFGGHAPSSTGVVLGQGVANSLEIAKGAEVTLLFDNSTIRTVTVSDLVSEPLGSFVYSQLDGSSPNAMQVQYEPGVDRQALRSDLSELAGVTAFVDGESARSAIEKLMEFGNIFIGTMMLFGVVLAGALVANTMTIGIAERRSEIATMQAAGVPRTSIRRMVAGENLSLTALSVVPGVLLGRAASKAFLAEFNTDVSRFDAPMRSSTVLWVVIGIMGIALLVHVPGLRSLDRIDLAEAVRERAA